jgi:hypothetical protein
MRTNLRKDLKGLKSAVLILGLTLIIGTLTSCGTEDTVESEIESSENIEESIEVESETPLEVGEEISTDSEVESETLTEILTETFTKTSEEETTDEIETYTEITEIETGSEEVTTDETEESTETLSDTSVENNSTEVQNTITASVIIDTDFASDADDMLAVRLGLIYQDLGFIDIKGIMLSTVYSKSPQAVSALCRWDGHNEIPVGMNTKTSVQVAGQYVDKLCELGSGYSDYTDTTKLYRKILSESQGKVNIITLGFLQNIYDLMVSTPDEYSPLSGMELIQAKVDKLYVVGGNLNGSPSFNFYWTGDKVVNAAKNVNSNYPGEIVYLVTDSGADVWNGSYHNSDWRNSDIVSAAMKANNQGSGIVGCDTMCLFEMIQDIYGTDSIEGLVKLYGHMYINDNGVTSWTNSENNENLYNRSIITRDGKFNGEYYSNKIDQLLYSKHKTFLK